MGISPVAGDMSKKYYMFIATSVLSHMAFQSFETDRYASPENSAALSHLSNECWDKADRALTVAKVIGEGLAFGIADGAKDAMAHKKETAAKLVFSFGAGLAMNSAERANPLWNFGTALAGVGLGAEFLFDTVQHGKSAGHAIEDVWRNGETRANVDAMKRALGIYAFDTALMATGTLGVAAAKKLPAEANLWFGVKDRLTSDPARSLIRIEGYGNSRWSAADMESLIASARKGVVAGQLQTAEDLDRFIAGRYITGTHGCTSNETRSYSTAGLLPKHEAYRSKLVALVNDQSEHTAKAIIGGLEFSFIKTAKISQERVPGEGAWILPDSKEAMQAAKARIDTLFSELKQNVPNLGSPGYVTDTLDRVAEMEWLNAQTWKYPRGSAGVSQLEARTWLEAAGIDSGRYKRGIDPNMEALTRSLEDFKSAYPGFFEKAPRYFSGHKLRRTLAGIQSGSPGKQPGETGRAVGTILE